MNKENRQLSNGKRLKYNYLDNHLNNSLYKVYRSPQRKQKSLIIPKRSSIQDFSPYRTIDYEHAKIQNNLLQQIMTQNKILNYQVIQYRSILSRLEEQLKEKIQKLQLVQETLSTDRIYYEQIIVDMKNQIQIVLSKNQILQADIKKIADLRTKERVLTQSFKDQEIYLRQQLSSIIINHQNNLKHDSLDKNHKIKSITEIKSYLDAALKRNITLEEFAKRIIEMYHKIQPQCSQSQDLKSLWKWLKVLGKQHNYFKKIRKPLAKYLSINWQKSIIQMIEKLFIEQLKIVI